MYEKTITQIWPADIEALFSAGPQSFAWMFQYAVCKQDVYNVRVQGCYEWIVVT